MRRLWCAAALVNVIAGSAVPACAEAVSAHWDAYFYAAPRANAHVLDEVQRGVKFDVQTCDGGWCQVRYGDADGYVREEAVRGPANVAKPDGRAGGAGCFTAAQPGGGSWQDERFCRVGP